MNLAESEIEQQHQQIKTTDKLISEHGKLAEKQQGHHAQWRVIPGHGWHIEIGSEYDAESESQGGSN